LKVNEKKLKKEFGVVRRPLEIFDRLKTAPGRRRLLLGAFFRTWRVFFSIAGVYRKRMIPRTRVVAVVGSLGKTTTTRAVHAALGLRRRLPEGWNSGSYLAVELLRIPPGERQGVLEVGISRRGMMARCARLLKPDIVVVTSIGSEHHRSLGTLEETSDEKAEMVRVLPPSGLAVLNGDDPNVLWMRGETMARVVTFGFSDSCDVRASQVVLDRSEGMRFTLHACGETCQASSRLVGNPMLHALLAAIAVACEEGVPLAESLPRLQRLAPTPGRLEMISAGNGAWLLCDTYKSAWETIVAGLDTLAELDAPRKIVVMGEIEQPRRPQGSLYRDLGALLARIASQVVFLGSSNACASVTGGARAAGMSRQQIVYAGKSPRRAADLVRENMRAGDVVLIKGRRIQHLERVAFHLAGRPIHCDIEACRLLTTCASCPLMKQARQRAWK
jgi:UDP-N-acetylmuramyl pentapeptide synthase